MTRRPSLVYSPSSSRTSSRSSSPPSSNYFSSLSTHDPARIPPSRDQRTSTPLHLTLASISHYLSLLLSLRLLLRSPRVTTLLLTLALLLSLEGRAKAERLGLKNTMGGILGGVGVVLSVWTAREIALEKDWSLGRLQLPPRRRQQQQRGDEKISMRRRSGRRFEERLCEGSMMEVRGLMQWPEEQDQRCEGEIWVTLCDLAEDLTSRHTDGGRLLVREEEELGHLRSRLLRLSSAYLHGRPLDEVEAGATARSSSRLGIRSSPSRRICESAAQMWIPDEQSSQLLVIITHRGGGEGDGDGDDDCCREEDTVTILCSS